MNHIVSPLRYPGGKSCIYKFVTDLFYKNSLIGINYAEPYAGGAGLALRLLADEFVDQIYINDMDLAIYSFWYSLKYHNTEFCDWLEDVKVNIENWNYYKSINSNLDTKEFSLIEIGKSTFFLNRTNVSGIIKGGIIGGLTQKGKYKIDARFNKKNLIQRIERISNFKHRINISKNDGVNFLRKIEKSDKKFFVYIDPPYVVKGADLYMNYFKKKDHERLAKYSKELKNQWMISYDNSNFISGLYDTQKRVRYKLSQSASNRIGEEILIFDSYLNFEESLQELNSPQLI